MASCCCEMTWACHATASDKILMVIAHKARTTPIFVSLAGMRSERMSQAMVRGSPSTFRTYSICSYVLVCLRSTRGIGTQLVGHLQPGNTAPHGQENSGVVRVR